MGAGDWIIGTAQAREAFRGNGKKAIFQHPETLETYWHEVFEGNPYIERNPKPGMMLNAIPNYVGHRPYFLSAKNGKVKWNDEFHATPGDLYLKKKELSEVDQLGPYIVVEPNICRAYTYSRNKDWGFFKWQELVRQTQELPWVQPIYPGAKPLECVRTVKTATFRHGAALVAQSLFLVGTDGGLHHAAAAVGKQAVIIWGGFTSPRHLGYDIHVNIHDGGEPCGTQSLCGHCLRIMKKIGVDQVKEEVLSLYSLMSNAGMLSSARSPAAVEGVALA